MAASQTPCEGFPSRPQQRSDGPGRLRSRWSIHRGHPLSGAGLKCPTRAPGSNGLVCSGMAPSSTESSESEGVHSSSMCSSSMSYCRLSEASGEAHLVRVPAYAGRGAFAEPGKLHPSTRVQRPGRKTVSCLRGRRFCARSPVTISSLISSRRAPNSPKAASPCIHAARCGHLPSYDVAVDAPEVHRVMRSLARSAIALLVLSLLTAPLPAAPVLAFSPPTFALFVEPVAGASPVLSLIRSARSSIKLEIYLLSDQDIIDALKVAGSIELTSRYCWSNTHTGATATRLARTVICGAPASPSNGPTRRPLPTPTRKRWWSTARPPESSHSI